ncbi:YihY/virulence factor BrkB family protein [Rivularia sp. UHCC 0363]|uniref:YihY/virulence factor BrkB family protein n=1 Tax=Rivularia sp. UHCC 0363 TaxID=3110244 RepID=UPI002B20F596|nr:YihY/virulence factor BrkB family protein [Rivularia sp. UHCC 0363]MEA5595091.1 YihY/virulence factor BrkB family protein [Rivularia sp. UHCC 0363]
MLKPRFVRFFRHLTFKTLRKIVNNIGKRRLLGLASEIAFNAMLSLFPAIIAILTAIGLLEKGLQSIFNELAHLLSRVAPEDALNLISTFARNEIANSKNGGLFSVSFVAALWTSSGAISTAMTALDQIQQVSPDKIRPFWKAKLVSLGLTIGTIILLLIACILVFISGEVLKFIVDNSAGYLNFLSHLWNLMRYPLALIIVASAFGFIYRYGPSRWKPGTPVMPGAIVAAICWAFVSNLFRIYVANFGNYNKAYGAIGTFIILMLWLYMTAAVILIGNQLNVTVGEDMHSNSSRKIK